MQYYATAIKTLLVAFASTSMIACTGGGTSRSSSNQFQDTDSRPVTLKPDDLNLSRAQINQENYYETASTTLKAVMFTDATSSALDRAATISRETSEIADLASGVDIAIAPFQCPAGGSVELDGEVNRATPGEGQLDFSNTLAWSFSADFQQCEQPGSRLTGDVDIDFTTSINELLNGLNYSLIAKMYVNDLFIEQVNLPPVTATGSFDYEVGSSDGVSVRTVVSTEDTLLADETDYQSIDYYLEKTVNTETQAYEYVINSIFSASFLDSEFIEYTTLEPLRGTGFAHPSSGKLAVDGEDSTLYITAMANDMVFLELDEAKDGTIDVTDYSSWSELTIDPRLQPTQ